MTERIRTELFERNQLMKKILRKGCYAALMLCLAMCFGMTVQAKGEETIKTGVYAESVDLSGKTKEEAIAAIDAFVEELYAEMVSLYRLDQITASGGKQTFGELPAGSKALLTTLAVTWAGILIYGCMDYFKKKKR